MTVSDIINQLSLTVFNAGNLDTEISGAYSSDLLSDVMGNAEEANLWITLQTHRNVAAIAALKELAAIILVKGNEPDDDTLTHAKEENITLLGSADASFELSGKIYALIKH